MSNGHFAKNPRFWRLVGDAVVVGALAGVATLAFTQIVRFGTDLIWPEDVDYGWRGGSVWWIGLLGLTGLAVGVLRVVLKVPDDLAGSLAIIQGGQVDRDWSLQAIGISIVSLVGGASLGPFDGGIRSGATVGDWWAKIRGHDGEDENVNTLSGINGALGSLLTAPFLATLLVTELRWPDKRQYHHYLYPSLTAAIIGFAINFAIVGDTFLGVFALPGYDIELWHFGLAVLLGLTGAALSSILGAAVYMIRRWVVPRLSHVVVRATVGGLALGLISVFLPLTLASGKAQLGVAITNAENLSTALLVAVIAGKIIAVAISLTTGFIGGPVMPALFIGGTAGLAVHGIFPDIPIALAFSCMLVAMPGVSLGAPFSMILLAILTVGIGAVETVPAGVAVLTAYLATAGMGWFGLPTERNVVDIDEVGVRTELFELGETREE
jgi:H+/Cl- antiporter ClcA